MGTATWVDLKGLLLHEKDNLNGHIPYASIYVTFLNWQNYRNREQISGWSGFGEGREGRRMGVTIKG